MCRRKSNNKGMSLVELIVAVAILAIIVLPLLRAFVVSTETNTKAKRQQRTTQLAQNIMEELEASSLETLAMNFDYPKAPYLLGAQELQELRAITSGGSTTYEKVKRSNDVSIPDYVTNPESFITSSIFKSGDTYKFIGQSDRMYYFALKDVNTSGRKYDALITLDGANTTNDKDLTSIYKMDQNHDAMSIPKKTAKGTFSTIQSMYPSVRQNDITRTITVNIEKSSSTKVSISYAFEFMYNGSKVTYPNAGSLDASSYYDVVFDNAGEPTRELNNIYLFYYPWYSSTDGNRTDKIVINNPDQVTTNLVLAKQEEGQSGLQTLDDSYHADVTLYEPMATGQKQTRLSLRTNLNENIMTGKPTVAAQAAYAVISNGLSQSNAEKLMQVEKLTEQNAKDRLFAVTVDIYEAGSYDAYFRGKQPIISITGGMAN